MLDVEPEALQECEALGTAPPWMPYALAGLAYEQFGVVPGDETARAAPSPAPVVLPLHTAIPTGPVSSECVA